MKMTFLHPGRVMLAMGALALTSCPIAFSQDTNGFSNSVPAPAATAAPVQPGTDVAAPIPRLPYGATDIVKLSRAHVSEDIILNYVHNSGTIYNLSAQDVLTLRNEGVSDQVIGAMLDQHTRVAATQPQPQAPPQQQVPAVPAQDPNAPMVPPATSPPVDPGYATPAPAPSTAYVIPYAPSAPYYGYSPYYYPYAYGGGPVISFGFGFGGWGHGYYGHYGHGYYYGHGGWGHGGWGHGGHH